MGTFPRPGSDFHAMDEVRSAWPCLTKPAQRYIVCFETLAQLALLQATHSHIGGGHYSFSLSSGTDQHSRRSRHQQVVQHFLAFAVVSNVRLQRTHVPGRLNDWADDLSRDRLQRFMNRPADRVRFSPASLAAAGRGLTLCPTNAPWRPEHLAAASTEFGAKPSALKNRFRERIPCVSKQFPVRCANLPWQEQPRSEGGVYGRLLSWPSFFRCCLETLRGGQIETHPPTLLCLMQGRFRGCRRSALQPRTWARLPLLSQTAVCQIGVGTLATPCRCTALARTRMSGVLLSFTGGTMIPPAPGAPRALEAVALSSNP